MTMAKQAKLKHASGFSMIEVLVTIVILAFGLLGLAGMQMHIQVAEMESYQRTQALILASDMAERILAQRTNSAATNYAVSGSLGKNDSYSSCSGLTGYDLDKCEWSLALKGSAETSGGNRVGAMIDARGCISQVQAPVSTSGVCTPGIYRVDVVWQGLNPTRAPAVTCGQNQYGSDDGHRRAISRNVYIGLPGCT